jgi:type IV secretory pathway TrbL component
LNNKIDILSKKSDVIYKKIVVLLALIGGSGAYGVKFFQENIYILATILGIIFLYSILGIGILYKKLNEIEREMDIWMETFMPQS